MTRHLALVSVGSNIDPRIHIRQGMAGLAERFAPLCLSPVYESRPVGFEGDNFLNLGVGFHTGLDARALVAALREIEALCGRRRGSGRLASRTLDLDLVMLGDRIERGVRPRLPRPELLRYAFVLKPMADLAGEVRHPEDGRRLTELWKSFDATGQPLWPVPFEPLVCEGPGLRAQG